jgi:DNA repair protein RecO (recombination protein O)
MKSLRTEAIIVRIDDHAEANQIITLLTEKQGLVSAFAGNSKKSVRRFGGTLDLFSRIEAVIKTSKTRENSSHLAETSLICHYRHLKNSLEKIAAASLCVELILALTAREEPDPKPYFILSDCLNYLDQYRFDKALLLVFLLKILESGGYKPELQHCLRCRQDMGNFPAAYFVVKEGGVICPSCRQTSDYLHILSTLERSSLRSAQSVEISTAGIENFRQILPLASGLPFMLDNLLSALIDFIRYTLGKDLKCLEFAEILELF